MDTTLVKSKNGDLLKEKRSIYLTIVDCNKDTLGSEEIFFIDSTLNSKLYPNQSKKTISFDEFQKILPHITDENTYSYRNAIFINQRGKLAKLLKRIKTEGERQIKHNFIKNIKWTDINATEIRSDIAGWRVSSNEYLAFVQEAADKNYSYAQCEAKFQFQDTTSKEYRKFMKSSQDSLFQKDFNDSSYFFTFGNMDRYAFRISDSGIISDINQDGYADKIAVWNTYYCAGVCGITRKSKNGLIIFFEYSDK